MKKLRELKEEKLYRLQNPKFDPKKILFKKQYDFISDPSPYADAVCSRRSGKTVACSVDLTNTALSNPNGIGLYITLSRNNAKKIIWPEMQRLNRVYNLQGKSDHTELSMRFGDDSIVYLAGANDRSEIEKFRGLPLRVCYIDETQSFPDYIRDLIDDVITPALMDYAGRLRLIGTPGPVPAGYFYDCSQSPTWSHHNWTFFDNPFITQKSGQSHQQLLQRELDRRGVALSDPSIQREWFGKWTFDPESLLLRYDSDKNNYEQIPNAHWNYIMGIDIGFIDADAIAVLAWSESDASTYLVEEIVTEKQGITELAHSIQALAKKYEIAKMVIDEGGLGKKIAEEIRRRHHIPLIQADKVRKMENVALLNDALRRGHFKAKKNSRFAQDSYLLEIDQDKTTPDKIRVKDSFHSDIIDAVLYAFRESPAYTYEAPIPKPKYGSLTWAMQQTSEMEQNAIDYFESLEKAEKGFGEF